MKFLKTQWWMKESLNREWQWEYNFEEEELRVNLGPM